MVVYHNVRSTAYMVLVARGETDEESLSDKATEQLPLSAHSHPRAGSPPTALASSSILQPGIWLPMNSLASDHMANFLTVVEDL